MRKPSSGRRHGRLAEVVTVPASLASTALACSQPPLWPHGEDLIVTGEPVTFRNRLIGDGYISPIGIAKQRLKSLDMVVPSDARQAFSKLQSLGQDSSGTPWNKVIGLRNALVQDYLNLDAEIVKAIIRQRDYRSLLAFAHEQLQATP